jgi:hypothetical protein
MSGAEGRQSDGQLQDFRTGPLFSKSLPHWRWRALNRRAQESAAAKRHRNAFGDKAEWTPLGRNIVKSILQPPHSLDEVGSGGLNEKAVVVPHQYPRPDPYPGAFAAFPHGLEEELLIFSIGRSKDSVPSTQSRNQRLK